MIVAIVILLLLTILATTMIGIGWVSKITASFYIEKTQSEFMTHSAIEFAATKILAHQNANLVTNLHAEWVFSGEDFNRNGYLDSDEDTNKNGLLDTSNVDLQDATLPSFFNPDIETISVGGKIVIPSLIYKNWGGKNINSYTFIKAIDTSSLICVNNIKNPGLKLMLNNLSEYLNVGKKLGDLLFEYLVTNENVQEITQPILEKIWDIQDKSKLTIILNHISLYCWEDKKVLKPAPSQNILNRIQNQNKLEISQSIEINESSYSFGIFAPININLAPSIIIKSSLNNLSALSFYPSRLENVKISDKISKLSELGAFWNYFIDVLYKQQKPVGYVRKVSLDGNEVEKVVEEIENIRSARLTVGDPFIYNLDEFFTFIENLVAKKILDYEKSILIFANANPNVYSYKFNPSFSKALRVDRLNLIDYSTTYTFFPPGIFKIEAYNVVMDKNNQIITRSYKSTYINLYQTINESTMDDFQKGFISDASQPTLNKKSLNIGPFPVLLFPNTTFPNYDGFLEFSPLLFGHDTNDTYENIKNGYGSILINNLSNNAELQKLLKKTKSQQVKKASVLNYSLLWDGVNYELLNNGTKNQYVKTFSNLFYAISQSNLETPLNLCFWFKLQIDGDVDREIIPFFNIAGYMEKEETPFSIASFNIRKIWNNLLFYNVLDGSYNFPESSMDNFSFNYFITNTITKPLNDVNTLYPGVPLSVCLSIRSDEMELYINGNNVAKQKDKIEEDVELEKLLGNINIEKTLAKMFFNGTIDYVFYLMDGQEKTKDNQNTIKKTFPQRYCTNCKDISYTTRTYQLYTLDKNCIVNLYWTDNATTTNLPDIYTITFHLSLFEANILNKDGKVLNKNPYDTSVGENSNGEICTNEFKVKIHFEQTEENQKLLESPLIDDLYIIVRVPKYKQVIFNEPEKFR